MSLRFKGCGPIGFSSMHSPCALSLISSTVFYGRCTSTSAITDPYPPSNSLYLKLAFLTGSYAIVSLNASDWEHWAENGNVIQVH